MATVTGLTAERMLAIEAASVVDGEIIADHLILTKHDGNQIDAGVVKGDTGATGPQGPAGTTDPWVLSADVWTFGAADAPSYTITTPRDVTTEITPGQRVRLTHGAAVKYFIVTKVAFAAGTSTVTLYGGTDYTLSATAITLVSFSAAKAPVGFPLDPTKWTVTLNDTSDRTQANASAGQWYWAGSLTMAIPIGSWRISWRANVSVNSSDRVRATLSDQNNTSTDGDYTDSRREGAGAVTMETPMGREKIQTFTIKTNKYLMVQCVTASTSTIGFMGTQSPTIVRAVCAYL